MQQCAGHGMAGLSSGRPRATAVHNQSAEGRTGRASRGACLVRFFGRASPASYPVLAATCSCSGFVEETSSLWNAQQGLLMRTRQFSFAGTSSFQKIWVSWTPGSRSVARQRVLVSQAPLLCFTTNYAQEAHPTWIQACLKEMSWLRLAHGFCSRMADSFWDAI